jgi:LPS-assembly protein
VEEPCLSAGSQEQLSKSHSRAAGFVDLRFGDSRIQADTLEMFTRTREKGGTYSEIVAEGNVVFLRGEERLAGEKLTMDLSSTAGVFENVIGFISPGVFVEARKVHRKDAQTYRIEGGKFTSCAQPTPRWSFSASSATLKVDDRIVAKNVLFKVKQVPALYIPIFAYPIQEDQRSTGILFPHFGYSEARGFNVGTGFFWAMGRSFDQTFYVDHYTDFGQGFGHEFRYALRSPSAGTFRSYLFRVEPSGQREYDLNWAATQNLPGKVVAKVNVAASSDLLFQEFIQDSLDLALRRTRSASLNLQRTIARHNVRLFADSMETFFPQGDVVNKRVNRHLPTFRVNLTPTKERRTGIVLAYEAAAENLMLGNQDRVDGYGRLDVYPRVSRPFSKAFLQVSPEVALRFTRWGASLVDDVPVGDPLDRRYLEGRMEVRGPTFSRVFNAPGNFYSERFKHVIGPEFTWTYRSAVDDFFFIPKYDGHDQVLGTNQLSYALVQRFYAKRKGGSGKLEPYEFLTWRLAQTYYVQIRASEFDPNFSSSAYGPGGVPDHNSPLLSRLDFRPTPRIASSFHLEYDINFNQLRSMSVNANVDYPRAGFTGNWSRASRVALRPENRVRTRDTLRGSARFKALPNRLALEGSADYDILAKTLRQVSGRVRYDIQCCGFLAEAIRSDFGVREDDLQLRFAIELANLGSIGNFMGQDALLGR